MIGGIPVDSEYIIFVVDTSGSMVNYVWPMLIEKVQETLNLYPKVKGFQIMDDEGGYMFSGYRGKWIPDTPAQRKIVVDRIRNWNAFSNSSPIEGIVEAIRTYYSKDKKISIYVFGDEFTGPSIDAVVKSVDVLNRTDNTGERRVRIHAIGFPVRPDAPQYTSIRFATLMRILCAKNGGTFVGLDDPARNRPAFRIGDAGAAPPASLPPPRRSAGLASRVVTLNFRYCRGRLEIAQGTESALPVSASLRSAGNSGTAARRMRPGQAGGDQQHSPASGGEDPGRGGAVCAQ